MAVVISRNEEDRRGEHGFKVRGDYMGVSRYTVNKKPIGKPPIYIIMRHQVPIDYQHSFEDALRRAYKWAVGEAKEYVKELNSDEELLKLHKVKKFRLIDRTGLEETVLGGN